MVDISGLKEIFRKVLSKQHQGPSKRKKPPLLQECPDLQIDEKWNAIQNVTIYSPLTDIFIPTGHKPFAIVGDMLTDLDRHLT